MNKIKEKIYYRILGLSIRCYTWSLDRYFDAVGGKRANTERIVKRTKMYSIPVELMDEPVSFGHDHNSEITEAERKYNNMALWGYEGPSD